jgi:hypothetical protein
MSANDSAAQSPSGWVRTLGTCWVVYGVLRLIVALGLFVFIPTTTVMFGALLARVPDPFTLMSVFHFLYAVMIVLGVLCGVCGILAGGALLVGKQSGRSLALVAGFLSLSNIPLGTTLGIYTLIRLLPLNATQSYARS